MLYMRGRMDLVVEKRVWVLAERLYIHAQGIDGFRALLRQQRLRYNNPLYNDFNSTSIKYTFMSEDNYDFADFMATIPPNRHLLLLERIVFDPQVQATTRDNWNYYGEPIRKWLPSIRDSLKRSGVEFDYENFRLVYPPTFSEQATTHISVTGASENKDINVEVLIQEIRKFLPVELHHVAEKIANLVRTHATPSDTEKTMETTTDSETDRSLEILAGNSVETTNAVIAFGKETQAGDITTGHIAGGNIINIYFLGTGNKQE